MNNYFNVAQAKSRFSEVLHRAEISPQFISSRGKDVGVVLSKKSYEKLLQIENDNLPKTKLKNFLALSKSLRSNFPQKLPSSARKSRQAPQF
ncbi:MAG TPA: type II toxin-antitoxin system prevent-host-death family antitoxin [Leptospiraceae bacterium]|nr:type II toxin-antitoxin system prevent-host-death family antitoxin [Leptospiraceae bacterium]HMW03741.1 type II toxin-antitoxin system prevent-host-death family antitoxin [Leptospiraceae bacterium]HMX31854.1 type II toxin-antitoxin system prevent-host-death family antitoxin [Leptospiraceae bacterium]HMY29721.1 type II toxin-antitoxin system prevent-host-death family antitoxin [Leptospiraceae bacterium]HMZ64003.1 type II toxin-antitoxin system prevent-host-death family antitoxin [Leptospirace